VSLLPPEFVVFAFVCIGAFGLLFGSFANVLIWRVPRGESIVSPGSHCPKCEHEIRWYDNVPVVSWLVLHGRCRDCGEPIAWRYPAVELSSGAVWLLAGWRFGLTPALPLAIAFFYLLLVLSVIDLDHRRLPTPLVKTLGIVAVVAAIVAQVTGLPFAPLTSVASSGLFASPLVAGALGFLLAVGVSWGIAALYSALRGRDGLGFGDVRLLGAMGVVLGPWVLMAYALANILGVFGAVPVLLRGRARAREAAAAGTEETAPAPASIPFGPFLALGGVLTALWGPAMWAAYLHFLGVGSLG
jgi:leader peptidase (prepilin peptidase) / N-methyltransferase